MAAFQKPGQTLVEQCSRRSLQIASHGPTAGNRRGARTGFFDNMNCRREFGSNARIAARDAKI